MAPELRPYQRTAVQSVLSDLQSVRATLVEAATGSGKTTIFSAIAKHFREDPSAPGASGVLVLVNRRELAEQAAAALRAQGLFVGVELGTRRALGSPVVVASTQTLTARDGARMRQWPRDAFGLVIVDEAQHAPCKAVRTVLDYFHRARILGVTATPDRADGISLGTVFQKCAFRYGIAEAVRDGYLVPVHGVRVEVPGMDLSKVRQKVIRAGQAMKTPAEGHGLSPRRTPQGEVRDLHPGDLARAVIVPEAVEGVTGPLLDIVGGRKTVIFAANRLHARALVVSLQAKGRTAVAVDGAMRASLRKEALAAFARGEYQFLVNVMLLTEGWDCPSVECVALARPTQSRIFVAQACGRGLRLHPGKQSALVVDFVGASCKYSLVGPEDVLAGAMDGPMEHGRAVRKTQVIPAAAYVAVPWRARFRTAAVDLLRRVVRGGGRVAAGAARGVRKGAGGVRRWLAAVATMLLG